MRAGAIIKGSRGGLDGLLYVQPGLVKPVKRVKLVKRVKPVKPVKPVTRP
jgi:hypothetical protein